MREAPAGTTARVHRILVVDDDEALLDALARSLEKAGARVAPYRSFEDARQALEHEPFDALVTDVRLGPSNGLQLAIIARQRHPDMHVIVVSGFDDPVLRAEAAKIGVPYLLKPVRATDLLELMRETG